ncbi:MAG: hypothetical protein CMF51_02125 [Legionellales bacterium]|nr:hypothetical protein [Legionellales bacterium]
MKTLSLQFKPHQLMCQGCEESISLAIQKSLKNLLSGKTSLKLQGQSYTFENDKFKAAEEPHIPINHDITVEISHASARCHIWYPEGTLDPDAFPDALMRHLKRSLETIGREAPNLISGAETLDFTLSLSSPLNLSAIQQQLRSSFETHGIQITALEPLKGGVYRLTYHNPLKHTPSLILKHLSPFFGKDTRAQIQPFLFQTERYYPLLIAVLSAFTLWILPQYLPHTPLTLIGLLLLSGLLTLISGYPIFRNTQTALNAILPSVGLLVIWTVIQMKSSLAVYCPPMIMHLSLAVILGSLVIQAYRHQADMYTAQALSIMSVLGGAGLSLAFPHTGFMMHTFHPLLIIAILHCNHILKVWIKHHCAQYHVANLTLSEIENGLWHQPYTVELNNCKQLTPLLKKDDVFSLASGQALPVSAIPVGEPVEFEIPSEAVTGEITTDSARISWHPYPTTRITDQKVPFLVAGTRIQFSGSNDSRPQFKALNDAQSLRPSITPQLTGLSLGVHQLQRHLITGLIGMTVLAGYYAFLMHMPIIPMISTLLMVTCPCLFCIAEPIIVALTIHFLKQHEIVLPHIDSTFTTLQRLYQIQKASKKAVMIDKTGTLTHPRVSGQPNTFRDEAESCLQHLAQQGFNLNIVSGDPKADLQKELFENWGEKFDNTLSLTSPLPEHQPLDQNTTSTSITTTFSSDIRDKSGWLDTYLEDTPTVVIGDGVNDQSIEPRPDRVIIILGVTPHADVCCLNQKAPLKGIKTLFEITHWAIRTQQLSQLLALGLTISYIVLTLAGACSAMMACTLLCLTTVVISGVALLSYAVCAPSLEPPADLRDSLNSQQDQISESSHTLVNESVAPSHSNDLSSKQSQTLERTRSGLFETAHCISKSSSQHSK